MFFFISKKKELGLKNDNTTKYQQKKVQINYMMSRKLHKKQKFHSIQEEQFLVKKNYTKLHDITTFPKDLLTLLFWRHCFDVSELTHLIVLTCQN